MATSRQIGLVVCTGLLHHNAWAEAQATPLYAISNRCNDPRYPSLAGPWVVGCGPDGKVDRALSLQTREIFELGISAEAPALGPGLLVALGHPSSRTILTQTGAITDTDLPTITDPLVAPPATDGLHTAVLNQSAIQVISGGASAPRKTHETTPLGWSPPAISWPYVAWVVDDGQGVGDVFFLNADTGSAPAPLSDGPGHQGHVVGHQEWLAWVEPGAVVVWNTATDVRVRHAAETGFSAAPTLWNDVACWETRNGTDIDVQCSDGLAANGPGHQQWPARWDRWLVYREGERVMLRTGPSTP